MGWLDHSTNGVLVDAVLTDKGRELLAKNDGSFSVQKFALGDDEVDYSIIKKYGRTVGTEKIIKNTPVFEAQTNESYGLKFKLISISNPNLIRLPLITLSGENLNAAGSLLSMTKTGNKASSTITVQQTIQNANIVDVELQDQIFEISMNNKFLQVAGSTPIGVASDGFAVYLIPRDNTTTPVGGAKVSFIVQVKNLTDSQFTTEGNGTSISTVISIRGLNSGAVKEFETQITK